jgi:hypothetical protein
MTRHYCCYFDHRYLDRGLAMIRSLHMFEPNSVVTVLCLDDRCYSILTSLAERNTKCIALTELEAEQPDLAAVKSSRSQIEYYFTCTAALATYVMKRAEEGDTVTYLDGDLFFFASVDPIYHELENHSVGIIRHGYAQAVRHLERFGLYNVGWVTFRHDRNGMAVLEWYRQRCIEWCYDRLDNGRFADQKYLDEFSSRFAGVIEITHPGANLAPWNVGIRKLVMANGRVFVNGEPVLFFHFHGMRRLLKRIFLTKHYTYRTGMSGIMRRGLYRPYLDALSQIGAELADRHLNETAGEVRFVEQKFWVPSVVSQSLAKLTRIIVPLVLGQWFLISRAKAYPRDRRGLRT